MGQLIEFKVVKARACDSPIKIKRIAFDAISVGFYLNCFNERRVLRTLRRIIYMQPVKLSRVGSNYDPDYDTYVIRLLSKPASEKEIRATFRQILIQIGEEIYANEISSWGKHRVENLAQPYSYTWADGTTISRATVKALKRAEINSGIDLIKKTREDICKIPGMTTSEVYRLERSLASRGLFLMTEEPPKWKK